MTDLFQHASVAAALAAGPTPRPVERPSTGLSALQPSGRFERHGKAVLFVHHCARCGSLDAPFGFLCHLGDAMDSKDARKAGIWLCGDCRDEVLAEETGEEDAA